MIIRGEFQKDSGVFNQTLEVNGFVDGCLEAATLLEYFLGAILIVPEIRFAYFCF